LGELERDGQAEEEAHGDRMRGGSRRVAEDGGILAARAPALCFQVERRYFWAP